MSDEQEVADAVKDDTIVAPTDTPPEESGETPLELTPWFQSEGVQGEGDAPEWFKGDKYKTVSDQAKAYTDLEGKFGSFTGAPEKYEVNLSDGNKENGIEIDSEDPLIIAGMELAKEAGMNQDGFDKFVNIFAMNEVAMQKATEEQNMEQFKALGDNGEGRINNLIAWGNKNLSPELQKGFVTMANSAENVAAMEALIAKSRPGAMNPKTPTPSASMTDAKLKEMQFATDENGNLKMSTDPEYKREVEGLFKDFYGGEEHNEIMS